MKYLYCLVLVFIMCGSALATGHCQSNIISQSVVQPYVSNHVATVVSPYVVPQQILIPHTNFLRQNSIVTERINVEYPVQQQFVQKQVVQTVKNRAGLLSRLGNRQKIQKQQVVKREFVRQRVVSGSY